MKAALSVKTESGTNTNNYYLPYHQIAMSLIDVTVLSIAFSTGTNGRGFDGRFQLTEKKIKQSNKIT